MLTAVLIVLLGVWPLEKIGVLVLQVPILCF